MGLSTLAGHRATTARANVPAWGRWFAEVTLDAEVTLTGRVSLVVADLTLSGTILSGGPEHGRSMYRVVAGAGGWGNSVPKKGYANDAGVKASTVLGDVAASVGETMEAVSADLRTGPAYARQEGPAVAALELVAPGAWYVDEAGVTRLGARASHAFTGTATRLAPADLARGKLELAADSIAALLPGVVVDGLTAVDVLHELSADGGLRSTLWGAAAGSPLRDLRSVLAQLDPDRAYRGVTEYRVVTAEGKRWSLQPVRVSSGMPDLLRVPVRPGVAGCEADLALGSRVLVGFVDSDPGRPYVAGFEDADGGGFAPTSLSFLSGTNGIARLGDEITITGAQLTTATAVAGANAVTVTLPIKGTISSASSKVNCG